MKQAVFEPWKEEFGPEHLAYLFLKAVYKLHSCNEAYQTPVTSNIRLISSQVTRKVSSVLLNYVLKIEQELRLLDSDSKMCRSYYILKDKVR